MNGYQAASFFDNLTWVHAIPGAALNLQYDDDDHNGTFDNLQLNHTPDEDDLVEMKLRILPENPSAELLQALNGYIVQLTSDNGALRFWKDAEKETGAVPAYYTIGTDTLPDSIWVEALARGTSTAIAKLGNGSIDFTTDEVVATVEETIVLAFDLDGGTGPGVDSPYFGLTASEWNGILASRNGWLNGWGEPHVEPPTPISYDYPTMVATYESFMSSLIQQAKTLLDSHPQNIDVVHLLARLHDPQFVQSTSRADYVYEVGNVIFKFDEYIHALRRVYQGEKIYLTFANSVANAFQGPNATLMNQIAALPPSVQNMPANLTEGQYAGLRTDLAAVNRSLQAFLDFYKPIDFLEPGLQGAQVAGGAAATILAGKLMVAGLANPATAPIVLTVGGLLLLNAAYGAYVRYEETFETSNRGDLGQAIFATVSDNVGATAYVVKWTGKDPFTGKPVEMGDFEFGVNVTASLMVTKFTIQQLARVKNSSGQLVWKVVDKIERQITSIDNWLTARNATPQTVLAGSATNPPMKPVLNPGPEAQIKTETFSFANGKAKAAAYIRVILRPFTQIAFGSSDLSAAAIAYRQTNGIGHSRNVAVIEFKDSAGIYHTVISASERGVGHAERLAANKLQQLGVPPSQVTRIYSDLQPCNVNFGYCEAFIRRTFPQAEVTYSFEYGATPESRQAGLDALRTALQQLGL